MGNARIQKAQDRPGNQLTFDVGMIGARQHDFFRNLTKATLNGDAQKMPVADTKAANGKQGFIDLDITAIGNPEDIRSFNGRGRLEIREADFGKIQIFGLLSRLLEGTWINFTSMALNKAKGNFDIKMDHLRFPKLIFSGPNSELHAAGKATIPDQQLDFRVNVFLGENTSRPITALLSPILKPMAYALELKLWGTMIDPKWRFTLDPRNMISPRQKPVLPPLARERQITKNKPLVIIDQIETEENSKRELEQKEPDSGQSD